MKLYDSCIDIYVVFQRIGAPVRKELILIFQPSGVYNDRKCYNPTQSMAGLGDHGDDIEGKHVTVRYRTYETYGLHSSHFTSPSHLLFFSPTSSSSFPPPSSSLSLLLLFLFLFSSINWVLVSPSQPLRPIVGSLLFPAAVTPDLQLLRIGNPLPPPPNLVKRKQANRGRESCRTALPPP